MVSMRVHNGLGHSSSAKNFHPYWLLSVILIPQYIRSSKSTWSKRRMFAAWQALPSKMIKIQSLCGKTPYLTSAMSSPACSYSGAVCIHEC